MGASRFLNDTEQPSRNDKETSQSRAAAYVRMSTEHQQYSTSNQMDVIREYAKRRGLEIVKEYSDEGKSGLNIQGRDSLAQMIRNVQDGEVNFSSILVYDVSRWGRFQDADESAYYEYACCRSARWSANSAATRFAVHHPVAPKNINAARMTGPTAFVWDLLFKERLTR